MQPECPWDHRPVERSGEFCGEDCYLSALTWLMSRRRLQAKGYRLTYLEEDWPPLLPWHEQPWAKDA